MRASREGWTAEGFAQEIGGQQCARPATCGPPAAAHPPAKPRGCWVGRYRAAARLWAGAEESDRACPALPCLHTSAPPAPRRLLAYTVSDRDAPHLVLEQGLFGDRVRGGAVALGVLLGGNLLFGDWERRVF